MGKRKCEVDGGGDGRGGFNPSPDAATAVQQRAEHFVVAGAHLRAGKCGCILQQYCYTQ